MPTIALIGNPNSGKSSLFNALAGTHQKVGNYPGVTVDVMSTTIQNDGKGPVTLLDMPGLYSMYPTASDERLVVDILLQPHHPFHPDGIIYTVDASHLESQLMLFTQLADMGFPIVVAVNMIDEFERREYVLDTRQLSERLKVPVIPVSSRTGANIDSIRQSMIDLVSDHPANSRPLFYRISETRRRQISTVFGNGEVQDWYPSLVRMHHSDRLPLAEQQQEKMRDLISTGAFIPLRVQVEETMRRVDHIKRAIAGTVRKVHGGGAFSEKLDRWLTHPVTGPVIFAAVMLFVFQAIFAWATYPMDMIEAGFAWLGQQMHAYLPEGWFLSLLADGLLAGLSGVLVFVPQIAILFLLITILEEVGYMARAVYLFDYILQRFGMNGRSVVALISGGACAIPAIMSTRSIENWKERLITIMVTPFISCSARIPVFALLVAFVVPYEPVLGVFNTQGLAFAALYVLGALAALIAAWVFKKILRSSDPSFLLLELPAYRQPDWTNVWVQVRIKVGAFIREAGKIIVIISLLLWFLASYGPPRQMQMAEETARTEAIRQDLSEDEMRTLIASRKIEVSFAGYLGKSIEPVIKPLGYDWKIGIALITSFAAREVFVGSMATIYSVGSDDDTYRIRETLAGVTDPRTGKPVFNYATALSLLLFFLLAMQCMSTLAVVREETGTWKWPVIQFVFMTGLAYVVSLVAYQLAS